MTEEELLKLLQNRPPAQTDYKVGYKKPPIEHQFKPGRSGNIEGRPIGAKNKNRDHGVNRFREMVLDEGDRVVEVYESGRKVKYPILKAAMRALMVKAAKCDPRSVEKALNIYSAAEQSRQREFLELFAIVIEYKRQWQDYLNNMAALGLKAKRPPIHPKHIHIDPIAGEFYLEILTDEQREFRDWMRRRLDEMAEANLARQQKLKASTDVRQHKRLAAKIQETAEVIASLTGKLDAAGLY